MTLPSAFGFTFYVCIGKPTNGWAFFGFDGPTFRMGIGPICVCFMARDIENYMQLEIDAEVREREEAE